ncbi:hypothetical protein [Halosimplex pelagicum]|uniref:Uncharacterized protein n=1 Tax=Halosimplex pelagicum TaxID=869886 RepID=A0A7D5PDE7_9EURY|nr:hypothetical protein [Halosimplex pelagicum]QLH80119.1 hypothetical protein HZS54_00090 [Halosimplex pelagicum]
MSGAYPLFPAAPPGGDELLASLVVQFLGVVILGLVAIALYRRFAGGR